MKPLEFVLYFIFFFSSLRSILYSLYLWQLKEYRFDRMRVHLKTNIGKKWLFSPLGIVKLFLLVSFFYIDFIFPVFIWPLFPSPLPILSIADRFFDILFLFSYIGTFGIFTLETALFFKNLLFGLQKFPAWTTKTIGIVSFSLFVLILIPQIIISQQWSLYSLVMPGEVFLLLFNKLIYLFITLLVFFSNIFSKGLQKIIILKARKKLEQSPQLLRIGITGSFGKTSTKEFLATILSQKYNVFKTEKMINTEIGVAQLILKNLKPEHEVAIIEMGAYKKGEIQALCNLIKPTIGVITGINEQHIDLFGSKEKLMEAKFELIESLPHGSVTFFNAESSGSVVLSNKAQKLGYRTIQYGNVSSPVRVSKVIVLPDALSFILHIGDKKQLVITKLIGKQHIQNILGAISVAHSLGISFKEIVLGVEQLITPPMTMEKKGEYRGAILIDDTFNVNPLSIAAAVEYMKSLTEKKYLVLQPMIELGKEASKLHEEIGKQIVSVCDGVFLTNTNYYNDIVHNISKAVRKKFIIAKPLAVAEQLKKILQKGDVVVFEGREARVFLEKLL